MADTETEPNTEAERVVIIGAGPAGLTAAWELTKRGQTATVLEADSVVGGISRTVERDGWRFDIGGHRFFTKVGEVEQVWHEILPDEDFLLRPRMSRIHYRGKFIDYPLRAMNALTSARRVGSVPLRVLVHRRAHQEAEGPDDVRGLGRLTVRMAALPRALQDLHREGVGGRCRQAARRLGGPAHQEPVARQGDHQRAAPEAEPEGRHLPDRGVPVPEVRAGDDVGGVPRQGRGGRQQGDHADGGDERCTTATAAPSP